VHILHRDLETRPSSVIAVRLIHGPFCHVQVLVRLPCAASVFAEAVVIQMIRGHPIAPCPHTVSRTSISNLSSAASRMQRHRCPHGPGCGQRSRSRAPPHYSPAVSCGDRCTVWKRSYERTSSTQYHCIPYDRQHHSKKLKPGVPSDKIKLNCSLPQGVV
jgi:hypothetical protein